VRASDSSLGKVSLPLQITIVAMALATIVLGCVPGVFISKIIAAVELAGL